MTERPSKIENKPARWKFGRRSFLRGAGEVVFFSIASIGVLKKVIGREMPNFSRAVNAGSAGDYLPMSVSEKYLNEEGFWICRDEENIFALISTNDREGEKTTWIPDEGKFAFSGNMGFTSQGIALGGSNHFSLERAKIALTENGELLVDKHTTFRYEKGEWSDPEAFIRL